MDDDTHDYEEDWAYCTDDSSLDLNVYDDEPFTEPPATSDRVDRGSVPKSSMNDLAVSAAQEVSHSPKIYAYSSLNTAAREIRLLEILPGSQSRSICCHVSTYHMDVAPAYVALSYEWGDPIATRTIIVNQSRYAIRQNLYDFLSEVSSAGRYEGCLFWIDAICINQEDKKERSHQVSIMAKIYRKAQYVVAWLGRSTSDSLALMATIAYQSSILVSTPIEQIWRDLTDRHQEAFRSLCKRSYWTRLWVVQELALASECDVLCGAASLPWQIFEAVLQLAEPDKAQRLSTSAYVYRHSMVRSSDMYNASHAFTMRQQIALFKAKATLTEHLAACCGLKCEDPLDRVYALLGLMGHEYDSITPDYHRERSALIPLVLKTQYAYFLPRSLDEIGEHCQLLHALLQLPESYVNNGLGGSIRWATEHQVLTGVTLAKQTPLAYDPNFHLGSFAAMGNCAAMTVILTSEQFDINLSDVNHSGMTALHRAISAGHKACAALLLQRADIDVNSTADQGATALHIACEKHRGISGGHKACAALLLQRTDIEVNSTNDQGLTALHIACEKGHQDLVRMMMSKAGVQVNARCNLGASPLHLACQYGHYTVVRDLLECKDVDLDLRDRQQQTPLHLIFNDRQWDEKIEIFHLLQKRGADLNALNGEGRNVLHLAVDGPSSSSLLEELINIHDVDVNVSDVNGKTPLYLAAAWKNAYAANLLLQSPNIDVNAQTSKGMSALHCAAEQGDEQVIEYLLELPGLKYDICNSLGESALHLAARTHEDSNAMASLLGTHEIDINACDTRGQAPLHHAVRSQRSHSVRALLQEPDINVNKRDSEGRTALHLATLRCTDGGATMSSLLERADMDVNTCDFQGWAPLHHAVLSWRALLLELLLHRTNIDVNVRSGQGVTPLHVAVEHHRIRAVCRLLKEPRVELNTHNHDGWTALHLAIREDVSEQDILKLLLGRSDIDVNICSFTGQTALDRAASLRYILAVSTLLKDSRVTADKSALLRDLQGWPKEPRAWPGVYDSVLEFLQRSSRGD